GASGSAGSSPSSCRERGKPFADQGGYEFFYNFALFFCQSITRGLYYPPITHSVAPSATRGVARSIFDSSRSEIPVEKCRARQPDWAALTAPGPAETVRPRRVPVTPLPDWPARTSSCHHEGTSTMKQHTWLTRRRPGNRTRAPRGRLLVELLEDRTLLS